MQAQRTDFLSAPRLGESDIRLTASSRHSRGMIAARVSNMTYTQATNFRAVHTLGDAVVGAAVRLPRRVVTMVLDLKALRMGL